MISLSSPVFDLAGSQVFLNGRSTAAAISRRAKRVATLDGGAVLSDLGYSDKDREFTLVIDGPTRAQYEFVQRLIATYQTAVLSCEDGCYEVLLSGLNYSQGQAALTASVLEVL